MFGLELLDWHAKNDVKSIMEELRNKKLSLDEIKGIEVEILNYKVSICDEHNLRYYLAYGTLIGAVRHKGFIPWDDDIDIAMPRNDYNALLEPMI